MFDPLPVHDRDQRHLDHTQEDLRPMSREEFVSMLAMVAIAACLYIAIMKLFV
jgi:hypothetical protein